MPNTPWLTLIGFGEDGRDGLCAQSQAALDAAEVIMAPPRHLALLGPVRGRTLAWPVPFADGLAHLTALRGQRVVVLASGDPFWFGAGSVIARQLGREEWCALPGPSCFALSAARLGWALEGTACLGLHAAPMARLRRHLAPGTRAIVTLRDGPAVQDLANYLTTQGFGDSTVTVFEHLGGPSERTTTAAAHALQGTFAHPVCAALEIAGGGAALTVATGQTDATFYSDGQMTKRAVRAVTLSTLAPKPHEHLWDIGGGSGSISLEWLLTHPTTTATCVEPRADRANTIARNATDLGVENRLTVVNDAAPDALADLAPPQAIFVGGGLSEELVATVTLPDIRLVINAVTLEGEALLAAAHARCGGELTRIALSHATPLGPKRGWTSAYPVVQWSLAP